MFCDLLGGYGPFSKSFEQLLVDMNIFGKLFDQRQLNFAIMVLIPQIIFV
jgi:hypothetical protein